MIQTSPIDQLITAPPLPPDIETPCAVVDLSRVRSNIERMAAAMRDCGVRLRPHFKTHKSVNVARLQIEAGACGLTVATIGEAEVLAAAGVDDLFIAYPLWPTTAKASRINELRRGARLAVGIDSVDGARHLAQMCGPGVGVLVEIDTGDARTGVAPEAAGDVADAAANAGLEVSGVFTHAGHSYEGPESAADDEVDGLTRAVESLRARGHEPRVVSAGSTPTAMLSARGVVTEERPGTYVFQDRQQIHIGAGRPSDAALVVAATVVSVSSDQIVLDAGAKSLAKDKPARLTGHGLIAGYPGCEIVRLNDHHAIVSTVRCERPPKLGQVVAVVPNHVCAVVNLFDELMVAERGRILGRWPVDARGRNS